jgi:antitoxin MazE
VESDLAEGAVVDMKLARGQVVMMPVRSHKPTLEELLEAMTEENLHGEIDFGPPAGKEVW